MPCVGWPWRVATGTGCRDAPAGSSPDICSHQRKADTSPGQAAQRWLQRKILAQRMLLCLGDLAGHVHAAWQTWAGSLHEQHSPSSPRTPSPTSAPWKQSAGTPAAPGPNTREDGSSVLIAAGAEPGRGTRAHRAWHTPLKGRRSNRPPTRENKRCLLAMLWSPRSGFVSFVFVRVCLAPVSLYTHHVQRNSDLARTVKITHATEHSSK